MPCMPLRFLRQRRRHGGSSWAWAEAASLRAWCPTARACSVWRSEPFGRGRGVVEGLYAAAARFCAACWGIAVPASLAWGRRTICVCECGEHCPTIVRGQQARYLRPAEVGTEAPPRPRSHGLCCCPALSPAVQRSSSQVAQNGSRQCVRRTGCCPARLSAKACIYRRGGQCCKCLAMRSNVGSERAPCMQGLDGKSGVYCMGQDIGGACVRGYPT